VPDCYGDSDHRAWWEEPQELIKEKTLKVLVLIDVGYYHADGVWWFLAQEESPRRMDFVAMDSGGVGMRMGVLQMRCRLGRSFRNCYVGVRSRRDAKQGTGGKLRKECSGRRWGHGASVGALATINADFFWQEKRSLGLISYSSEDTLYTPNRSSGYFVVPEGLADNFAWIRSRSWQRTGGYSV